MYIVTGASSGIGRATAKALIERHCDLIITARRAERLDELVALAPERVRPVCADLASPQGVAAIIAAVDPERQISGLVHAAGSPIVPTPYHELNVATLASDMTVHVGAPIALNAALHRRLIGGRVVYIDSFSATDLRVGWSGYSIVKAAAQMAARAASSELDGVTVVRVFPGGVRTPLVEAVLESDAPSPAVAAFRASDERGELSPASPVGTFIGQVLVDVSDAQLAAQPTWNFTDPDDRQTAATAIGAR